ncbi:MAG: DUF58 domain-containing protein [Roseburia sp.]|nr:DUF58 domain-containing protein [Roseburia sp.]
MKGMRIAYVLTAIAALVGYIVTDNGVALFLCVCLFVFPFLSLAVLFICKRRVKFSAEVRESCIRGGALRIAMRVGVPRLSIGAVIVTAEIENSTFGKTEIKTFMFKDLSFAEHVYEYVGSNAGRITVRFTKITLTDLMGLCAVSLPCSIVAEASVSPVLYDDLRVRIGATQTDSLNGEDALPQKGSDITEIYNVRDYEAGDAPNTVHWKLTAKLGSLQIKEFGRTDDNRTLILVDLSRKKFGEEATDAQLNAVLDIAVSLSAALKNGGITHSVGWFNGGQFECTEVVDSETLVQMVYKLMSIKVCEGNSETLFYFSRATEHLSFTKVLFVTSAVQTSELNDAGSASVTVLVAGDRSGETEERGIKIVDVPLDNIGAALMRTAL